MSELKIPDDLNSRYDKISFLQNLGVYTQDNLCSLKSEAVLIERIAALEAVRNNLRQAAIDLAAKADEERNGRIWAEAENAQLRLQIAALKAPVSDEEWLALCSGDVVTFADVLRRDVDELIAARAKETL